MGSRGRSSRSGSSRSSGGSGGGFGSSSSGYKSYGGSRSSSFYGGYGMGYFIGSLLGRNSSDYKTGEPVQTNSGDIKYKRVRNKKATLIACLILSALTVFFIVMASCGFGFRYGRVSATVESVYARYEFGEKYYYTSYNYQVDGQWYSAESQSGWTLLPESIDTYIGSQYDIYYEKDNPYIIYEVEDKENIPSAEGLYTFLATIGIIVTIVIAVVGIGKYEIDKQHEQAKAEIAKNKTPEGARRCAYCNSIVSVDKDKCPSCGAPLK